MSKPMLDGRRFLVLGVANKMSIAWGIARELRAAGADLALTYMNEAIEKRVRPLAGDLGCDLVLPCDVQSDTEVDQLFRELEGHWDGLDGIVHSVAFADRSDLDGRFVDTSRLGFARALDISAYSLVALAQRGRGLLAQRNGSLLTLTYLGSQRVFRNYKVMGVAKAALEAVVRYLAYDLGSENIRVNAISAGPIRTLAASGIPEFRDLLTQFTAVAPLGRSVTVEDVAQAALFLLGPAGAGITGEITHVDCGFNVMGMGA